MLWFANDIRTVLWVAVVPGAIAVALLIFGVQEPERAGIGPDGRKKLTFADFTALPRRYWFVVFLGLAFTLARFSEAFLVLRAHDLGLGLSYVPLVLIVMNAVYAGIAYPAGVAADKFSQRTLLVIGMALLVTADIVLATAKTPFPAFIGAAFWGMHMGFTQGLFAKLVADNAPAEIRGTAFGIFNLISGGALLFASLVAGYLWSAFGAPATFLTGAAFAVLAMLGLFAYRDRPPTARKKVER
jgi:MFS family permease